MCIHSDCMFMVLLAKKGLIARFDVRVFPLHDICYKCMLWEYQGKGEKVMLYGKTEEMCEYDEKINLTCGRQLEISVCHGQK